ncbi:MAG: holo-ACP synthase [Chloroflexi bacterium]|nr:holo-ACP synthase [Chloroflexota bacterium]
MSGPRVRTGVDLIEIERIRQAHQRYGQRFLNRIYTPVEQARCRGRADELAARFAAKEAVSKALGTGMRGVLWKEIEVVNDPRGKPLVRLYGAAERRAAELGIADLDISLTHSRDQAIAFVVALSGT